jgi:hypothetical protein
MVSAPGIVANLWWIWLVVWLVILFFLMKVTD